MEKPVIVIMKEQEKKSIPGFGCVLSTSSSSTIYARASEIFSSVLELVSIALWL